MISNSRLSNFAASPKILPRKVVNKSMETGTGCPSLLDFLVGKSYLSPRKNVSVYDKTDLPQKKYSKASPRYNLFGAVGPKLGASSRTGRNASSSGRNNLRLHNMGLVNARAQVRK
jgi:hypothetical protein